MSPMRQFFQILSDTELVGTQSTGVRPSNQLERHFGRLFDSQPNQPEAAKLIELARDHMEDDLGDEGESDVPIGIAFLGQFIDHDVTFDTTTVLARNVGDPTQVENFRTPRLELDSVYSTGPDVTPYLYGVRDQKHTMVLGTDENSLDLQRNRNGTAIIGDPRNDENFIVAQIHGREFIGLHNKQIEILSAGQNPTRADFEKAQEIVRGVYQRRILTEFLPAVIDLDVLTPLIDAFNQGDPLPGPIDWDAAPDMPVEFSAAAFRFGHSMIREEYLIRRNSEETRGLFELGGFGPIPNSANIEFSLFFDRDGQLAQAARKKLIRSWCGRC